MGQSTNGILAYGYDLGGEESGWKIAEADEYGDWVPHWQVEEDDDLATAAERLLMASVGFTETDHTADGFFDRRRAAEARLGVQLTPYCSSEYPMWLLTAHTITVYRGNRREVAFPSLDMARALGGWDAKLAHALTVLGVTPKQERPGWLLVSYWC